ncbi:MAG: CPBP family intramembrane metalloprotease [Paludibacter sp.]|nr:CPBP family intramembrane metalloprotease [Paludibacter sp.]
MDYLTKSQNQNVKYSLSLLWGEIKDFIKHDFNILAYAYTLTFTVIILFLNYKFDFYSKVMRPTYNNGNSIWAFFVLYSVVYFAAAIPNFALRKEYALLKNPKFYIKSLFLIFLYALCVGWFSYRNWEIPSLSSRENAFVIRLISNAKSIIFITLPLIVLKIFYDKKVEGLYGLSKNSKHIKVYLLALAVIVPFVIAASFSADFQSAYPQFQAWRYQAVFKLPTAIYTAIFEFAYLGDFINTELFFRGAMIVGMMAILGKRAVLPMVVFYVSIHFGKPLGEAVSSMFGGYILGVLAYQTRHIWGGVLAHIGIAFTMEIMGLLQYYFLSKG